MARLTAATVMPFLYVTDWSRCQHFYRDLLGLTWEPVTADWVQVGAGHGALALLSEGKRHETGPVHRSGVFFAVPAGLADLVADLAQAGVPIVRPLHRFSHGAEAAVADPDGNVLVLYETAMPAARSLLDGTD